MAKKYNKITRSDAKYIRLTEALDMLNETVPEDKKLTRETLLARIRRYESETQDTILKQDPTPCPTKSPLLVDYDKLQTSIPSLMKSSLIDELIQKVESQQEQLRVLYEIMYMKGFLRKP